MEPGKKTSAKSSKTEPTSGKPIPDEVARREEARLEDAEQNLGRPQTSHDSPPQTPPEGRRRDTKPATVEKTPRKKLLHQKRGPGSFA